MKKNLLNLFQLLIISFISLHQVTAQRIDTDFKPRIKGLPQIYDAFLQSDGKLIIGGNITMVGNNHTSTVVRLNQDGTLDSLFNPIINGLVLQVASQKDGKVIVGGQLKSLVYPGLIRYNIDGSIDSTFNPPATLKYIVKLLFQDDGKIVVKHLSLSMNGLTRLNEDGSLDETFDVGAGANRNNIFHKALAMQDDGKILIAGSFSVYNNQNFNGLVRLNPDGSIDETFDYGTGPDNLIKVIACQPDGKIILGGRFDDFSGFQTSGIIRLNPDGSVDESFINPGPVGNVFNKEISDIFIQEDDKIVVTGIEWDNGTTKYRVVRLNQDGSIDLNFYVGDMKINVETEPGPGLISAGNGEFYIFGNHTWYDTFNIPGIVKLKENGVLNDAFNLHLGDSPTIKTAEYQPDGKLLLGGEFYEVNGVLTNNLVRLNVDGSVDMDFVNNIGSGSDADINSLAIQDNGNILIGGDFNTFDGRFAQLFLQLTNDGKYDSSFIGKVSPKFGGLGVNDISLHNSGIFIGGVFKYVNYQPRNSVAALEMNGDLVASFLADPPYGTGELRYSIIDVQPNDAVYLGGMAISETGNVKGGFFYRTDLEGNISSTFTPLLISDLLIIESYVFFEPNRILIGGRNGNKHIIYHVDTLGNIINDISLSLGTDFSIARFIKKIDEDEFIVGGIFEEVNQIKKSGIARVNINGIVDEQFRFDLRGGSYGMIEEEPNRYLVYGDFKSINSESGFSGIARINIGIPYSPDNLSGEVPDGTYIDLSWKDNSYNELSFEIERSNGDSINFTLIDTVDQDTSNYKDDQVESGVTYYYRVRATGEFGISEYSSIKSVHILNPPSNLEAISLDEGGIKLTWSDNSELENGFEIERSLTDQENFLRLERTEPNDTSYLDSQVVSNNTYFYRIRAFNDQGFSEMSDVASVELITSIDDDITNNTVSVFPNPFSHSIQVDFSMSTEVIHSVRLINAQGRIEFYQVYESGIKPFSLQFDTRNIPNGLYLIELFTIKNKYAFKIIKN